MAAWMPPWALPVLQEAGEPLAISTVRAPSRDAAHAAARPAPPLPITSTSARVGSELTGTLYRRNPTPENKHGLCIAPPRWLAEPAVFAWRGYLSRSFGPRARRSG